MHLTPEEIETERAYRVSERLAILCEDRPSTREQREIARKEADAWEAALNPQEEMNL